MSNVKLFEVRDRGTFIPVMAVSMAGKGYNEKGRWLLRREGYPYHTETITLIKLSSTEAHNNAFDWGNVARTMHVAHLHIEKFFDSLESGAVIDVEFILGESAVCKQSEYLDTYL